MQRVRNTTPIKINEFRVTSGAPGQPEDQLFYRALQCRFANRRCIQLDFDGAVPVRQAILLDDQDSSWNQACAQRLLLTRAPQLGHGRPRARRRQHSLCQEHGWHVDWATRSSSIAARAWKRAKSQAWGQRPPTTPHCGSLFPMGRATTIPAGSTNVPVEYTSGSSLPARRSRSATARFTRSRPIP